MHIGANLGFGNLHENLTDAEMYQGELRIAELSDRLGFDSLWSVEHHFDDYAMCPDNVVLLANVAARTRHIRLGTGAVILPWNDPLRVAEKMIMLDILSGGRAIFGMGRGLSRVEYAPFGIPMAEAGLAPLIERLPVILTVPPIRERAADIPAMVAAIITERLPRPPRPHCTPEALAALIGRDWPGNARELRQVVATALARDARRHHGGRPAWRTSGYLGQAADQTGTAGTARPRHGASAGGLGRRRRGQGPGYLPGHDLQEAEEFRDPAACQARGSLMALPTPRPQPTVAARPWMSKTCRVLRPTHECAKMGAGVVRSQT